MHVRHMKRALLLLLLLLPALLAQGQQGDSISAQPAGTDGLQSPKTFPFPLDHTYVLLGMLNYSYISMEADELKGMVAAYRKRDTVRLAYFLQTADSIAGISPDDWRIQREGDEFLIYSDKLATMLEARMVLFPHRRPDHIPEWLRSIPAREGYVNPYIMRPEQQASYLLGLLIALARVNPKGQGELGDLYMQGPYKLRIRNSKALFDMVVTWMHEAPLGIRFRSSSIRTHTFRHGFEEFFGIITLDLEEPYRSLVDRFVVR